MSRKGIALAGGLAVACLLSWVPSASALGLTNLSAQPASTQAGANSDFSIKIGFTAASDKVKDLTIHLPPGLVGNPLAATACTEAKLQAMNCPASSDVGDVSNDVTVTVLGFVPLPLSVSGDVFNVVPRAGEPARFGIVLNPLPFNVPVLGPALLPPIVLQSPASLRQDDFGLDTTLNNLPTSTTVAGLSTDVQIDSVELNLSGTAGSPPRGFMRNPTSCAEATTRFDATSYASPGTVVGGSASFTPTGCASLPFTPELTARLRFAGVNQPVEVSTTIAQTIEEAGLESAQVVLPSDLAGNIAALGNTCPPAAFAGGSCPQASLVGTAAATSPLLAEPLDGTVALVQEPGAPGLPNLGVDLRGALALKVIGAIGITAPVRSTVTFTGLPDIPIAEFTLTFDGGPGGLTLANRDLCEPPAPVLDALFGSHAGGSVSLAVPATVSGCGGGHGRRKPTAKLKLAGTGSPKPRLKLKLRAGAEQIAGSRLRLPHELALARGARFMHGTKAKADGRRLKRRAVTRGKRRLTLKTPAGAKRVRASLANGALVARKRIRPGSRLRFPIRIEDTSGKTTKIIARTRARR